jgi:hypothetical protein
MPEDRTEELKSLIADFDSQHDEWLRRGTLAVGRFQMRHTNNRVGRFLLSRVATRILARLIVKKGLFGIEDRRRDDLIEIAMEWLKLSIFLRIPTEVAEANDDRVIVLRPECTVGYQGPECAPLCRASMNMDMDIVKRLGGRLVVTETILEGAPKCRHIITRGD